MFTYKVATLFARMRIVLRQEDIVATGKAIETFDIKCTDHIPKGMNLIPCWNLRQHSQDDY
jgi:hypothetical protein